MKQGKPLSQATPMNQASSMEQTAPTNQASSMEQTVQVDQAATVSQNESVVYTADAFCDWLYTQRMAQTPSLQSVKPTAISGLAAEKKARLRTVLGLDALQKMACPPEWRVLHTREQAGYREEECVVQTLPGLYTPVYILTPTDCAHTNYRRTFIYCHGHGRGAEEAVDARYTADYQKCLPITLARAGYRVIVPELIGFNRVVATDYREASYGGCYAVSTRLLMYGITMTAVRVNQVLQLVDWVNRTEATAQSVERSMSPSATARPVVGGISGGGLVAAYTAALCDTIAGAFIAGYANTFKGSIMALYHCVDNFVPDILSIGEEPEIIALACPTPLLLSNGSEDDIFPVAHTRTAIETIKALYARQNARQHVTAEIFNGGHQISTAALMPWLAGLA